MYLTFMQDVMFKLRFAIVQFIDRIIDNAKNPK